MARKTLCFHLPYPADDADMPCSLCYAVEETRIPKRTRQPARIVAHKPMTDWNQGDIARALEVLESLG